MEMSEGVSLLRTAQSLLTGRTWKSPIEKPQVSISYSLLVKVIQCFVQGWDDEVHNSSRANTYKLISNFSFKEYLDFVTVRKFRYAFTRLRVASHRLEIETGRWHKPNRTPIEERKCLFCNCLEDEFHFVLECQLYQDLRNEYIKKYFWKRPNIPKFIELLQSENKKTIKKLSVYIYKSFKKRN